MSQSRLGSLAEALINVAIGFGINFAANWFILPLFGFSTLTLKANLLIGVVYTVISVIRSYVIRRWFNQHIVRAAQALGSLSNKEPS